MATKYIFVTGGVVSGLGKGITASSLGRLLKARGYKIIMQKFDPYINMDPGTMNPIQHGEVYVTEDGVETDLDLGHYERFIDEDVNINSNVTTGKIYWEVMHKEREGFYGGHTVQVIPHITDEIKRRFYHNDTPDTEIAIIEIGGTVGDIESQPFLEAIRQFQQEVGKENCIVIHVTLIVYLNSTKELKTKPTQTSVKALQSLGIQPDFLVCRSDYPLDITTKEKLSLFCNVDQKRVIENLNLEMLYEIVLMLENEGLAVEVCKALRIDCPQPDLKEWHKMLEAWQNPKTKVTVALVGKYMALHDAYLSVVEALKHAGLANHAQIHIKWIDSETVTFENANALLHDVDCILVPGGFGSRGIQGKIEAIRYARENQTPFLGICLGLQLSLVEFARNVCKLEGAHSTELDPNTKYPIIAIMPDKEGLVLGGTLRLGAYKCNLVEGTRAHEIYGVNEISERHRHRYEVNNDYREILTENGMVLSGFSPDNRIVEMIELSNHPYFVATQAHPEFKSRPNKAHPLFREFIKAAIDNTEKV